MRSAARSTWPRKIQAAVPVVSAAVVPREKDMAVAMTPTSLCIAPTWYRMETTELRKITIGMSWGEEKNYYFLSL